MHCLSRVGIEVKLFYNNNAAVRKTSFSFRNSMPLPCIDMNKTHYFYSNSLFSYKNSSLKYYKSAKFFYAIKMPSVPGSSHRVSSPVHCPFGMQNLSKDPNKL